MLSVGRHVAGVPPSCELSCQVSSCLHLGLGRRGGGAASSWRGGVVCGCAGPGRGLSADWEEGQLGGNVGCCYCTASI